MALTYFGACDSAGNPTGATSSGTGSAETDWNNTTTFTCPGSGPQTVMEISAFIKVVTAYNFRLAIFDAAQTTLIAQGTAAVAASGASDNWQGHMTQASITPNPITLTGGTNYTLVITASGDLESDHWVTGASGTGRFVSTDFTAGFTNASLGSPSAATLVPPVRVGIGSTGSSSSIGPFQIHGAGAGPLRIKRLRVQQLPDPTGFPPSPPDNTRVWLPFKEERGPGRRGPPGRMAPQRYPDTFIKNISTTYIATWTWIGSSSPLSTQIAAKVGAWSWQGKTSPLSVQINASIGKWTWQGTTSTLSTMINQTVGNWSWSGTHATFGGAVNINATIGAWTWKGNTSSLATQIGSTIGQWTWSGTKATLSIIIPATKGQWTWRGTHATVTTGGGGGSTVIFYDGLNVAGGLNYHKDIRRPRIELADAGGGTFTVTKTIDVTEERQGLLKETVLIDGDIP